MMNTKNNSNESNVFDLFSKKNQNMLIETYNANHIAE